MPETRPPSDERDVLQPMRPSTTLEPLAKHRAPEIGQMSAKAELMARVNALLDNPKFGAVMLLLLPALLAVVLALLFDIASSYHFVPSPLPETLAPSSKPSACDKPYDLSGAVVSFTYNPSDPPWEQPAGRKLIKDLNPQIAQIGGRTTYSWALPSGEPYCAKYAVLNPDGATIAWESQLDASTAPDGSTILSATGTRDYPVTRVTIAVLRQPEASRQGAPH